MNKICDLIINHLSSDAGMRIRAITESIEMRNLAIITRLIFGRLRTQPAPALGTYDDAIQQVNTTGYLAKLAIMIPTFPDLLALFPKFFTDDWFMLAWR